MLSYVTMTAEIKIVTHTETAIDKKNSKKTKILKESKDHVFKKIKVKKGLDGLGLFAEENIKKGETIIEYVGIVLLGEEAKNVKDGMYLFEVSRNKTIDGSPRWNLARYCNHSCDGNAESEIKKGRVFMKAIKNIKMGEEIVYDYGEEFVKEYIAPKGCRCSAKKHSYTEITNINSNSSSFNFLKDEPDIYTKRDIIKK